MANYSKRKKKEKGAVEDQFQISVRAICSMKLNPPGKRNMIKSFEAGGVVD